MTASLGATFGGMHAVSGATTEVSPVLPSENPAQAKVGEEFTWVFRTERHKARSYDISGLPPGIEFPADINNSISFITGVPTEPGQYEIEIQGFRGLNFSRDETPVYTLILNVEGGETESPFDVWRASEWSGEDLGNPEVSGATGDPDRDGLANLLEYALGSNPNDPRIEGRLPRAVIERSEDGDELVFSASKNPEANDVLMTIEKHEQGEVWLPVVDGEAGVSIVETDELLTARFPLTEKIMLRLHVELPE
ncbi:MAG: hypothetical protein AAF514_15615 [Verrucomicrobiota bacterium]